MQPPRPSRKEARALSKNLKAISAQEGKARLIARLNPESEPRIGVALTPDKLEPRAEVDPGIIWSMKMTWCATASDVDGKWSWHEQRQWTDDEFQNYIQGTLNLLQNSTWGEIHQMRSGGLVYHHSQEISSVIEEAQERWGEKEIATDVAFRFRLTGRQRAWGFREGAHFKLVWYDRYHNIYPVEKSNT